MSTSIPSGSIFDTRNYVDIARPFKNPDHTRSSTGGPGRRTKTLKQILAAEREVAMGGDTSASGKRKGKKVPPFLGSGSGYATASASRQASTQASRVGSEEAFDGDITLASVGDDTSNAVDAVDAIERAAAAKRKRDLPTYSSVEAPPSLRPRKKFCDITGLLAPYTDPKTNLRYHSVEIYDIIKTFGPGVDQAYLSLRGESSQIK